MSIPLEEARQKEKETWNEWENALTVYKGAEKKARALLPEEQKKLVAEEAWNWAYKQASHEWSTTQDKELWAAWESAKHAKLVEQKTNAKRQMAWSRLKSIQKKEED